MAKLIRTALPIGTHPTYRVKRMLRLRFDNFQTDRAFNLPLATPPMREATSMICSHRRGVMEKGRARQRSRRRARGLSGRMDLPRHFCTGA
jgi:hypothetical protein